MISRMNTISKLTAGALLLGLWSCSSDEPAYNAPSIADGKAYLAVDIMDANSITRASEFEDGSKDENAVSNSLFVFFDASGHYMCTGKISSGDFTKPGLGENEGGNVESIGKNIIVMSGLNGIDFPRYMLTILNNPDGLEDKIKNGNYTMQQTEKLILEYVPAIGSPFIMTTSTHGGTDSMVTDISNYSLMTDVPEDVSSIADENWVRVYVERLSAGVDLSLEKKSYGLGDFQIGSLDENGNMTYSSKKLNVRIDGWGLNSTARTTYLSKDIEGLVSSDKTWVWDNPDFHRSYWGKSVCYGSELDGEYVYLGNDKIETPYSSDVHSLKFFNWSQLTNSAKIDGVGGTRAYCLENTNTVANLTSGPKSLISKNVTCAIVKATLVDDQGKEVDVIRYQGVLFEKKGFVPYALNLAKAAGYLPYYTAVTGTPDDKGEVETEYTQLSASDFEVRLTGDGTGIVSIFNKVPAGTKVYRKKTVGEKSEYELVEDHKDIDKSVQTVVGTAMAYTGGAMFYTIPIRHIRALKDSKIIEEGNYGIVRNHLYQISVSSIKTLGNGVFEPGRDTDVKPGEPIIPDDPNPEFYLSARINILAWRVVNQEIDL